MGKRVLVAGGTMGLIRNGVRDAPLDRAHTFLEMQAGGQGDAAGTLGRIRSGFYDRIYLNYDWYGYDFHVALRQHYHQVWYIEAANEPQFGMLYGYQGLMGVVLIYERRRAQSED